MLSPAQLEARDGRLTASRVACLMAGDEGAILNLWREMVGDPAFVPEDLSGVWPVQLGSATEPLNVEWFSRKHGLVSRIGEVVIHANGWAAATLDGWSERHECPIEAKHCGGREPLDTIITRYHPQMHWQMLCTGASQCALSVIMGTNEPIVEFVQRDKAYSDELMRRAETFMGYVHSLTPPVVPSAIAAPVKVVKTYDMNGSNTWAAEAGVWLENIAAKKKADGAEKGLKALVPSDAIKCHGYGVQIMRDRAGRLSLKEMTT